jgi:hypothetical protein
MPNNISGSRLHTASTRSCHLASRPDPSQNYIFARRRICRLGAHCRVSPKLRTPLTQRQFGRCFLAPLYSTDVRHCYLLAPTAWVHAHLEEFDTSLYRLTKILSIQPSEFPTLAISCPLINAAVTGLRRSVDGFENMKVQATADPRYNPRGANDGR